MSNAIKCPACGLFYNGARYTQCPYCKENTDQKAASATVEQKTHGIWGIFEKKTKEEKKESAIVPPAPIPEVLTVTEELNLEQTIPLYSQKPTPAVQQTPVVPVPALVPVQEHPVSGGASGITLSKQLSLSGRTVGKYISNSTGEGISPVVGWLVGTKGAYRGQSFNLKSGRNKIGRSHEMDVKLLNDDSVSRSSAAVIIFDAKAGQFFIIPGDSDSLCYVNDAAVYERRELTGYEQLEFGDAGMNQYVFVPFCGERFNWSEPGQK